ncbi:MAG: hypothetical protein ABJM43_22245 [Paracoccaceae bacterium]
MNTFSAKRHQAVLPLQPPYPVLFKLYGAKTDKEKSDVRRDLMGHSLNRERYGQDGGLAFKEEMLQRIAF